jgi:hypothetical protein
MRPTIKLVDTSRSTEGKLFESDIYVHIYEKQKALGKMQNWIPKDKIDSIKTEIVEDTVEDEIVIEELTTETEDVNVEGSTDFELMSLEELKEYADENGIKYHPNTKSEEKMVKKLKDAGH